MTIAIETEKSTNNTVKTNPLYDLIQRLRDRLLNPKPGEPSILAKFGWLVIDHLGLVSSEILPAHSTPENVLKTYEEIARRYLDVVLPDASELSQCDGMYVAELVSAINLEQPEPGRMTAAFGAARMNEFGKDLRLVYRVGAYRGKPGNTLTDYLIAKVIYSSA